MFNTALLLVAPLKNQQLSHYPLISIGSGHIKLEKFYQWFLGFSDGEASFSIVPKKDKTGKINRFTFMFSIGLHLDDIDVLYFIQKSLGIGIVSKSSYEYGIKKLFVIFDKYNLNTTKYLDYLDFKEAFNLYHSRDSLVTEKLKENILNLKNRMNTNRVSFDLPFDHKIKITTNWLLGLIEADGIVQTELQLPVILKIKEFLMAINIQKARGNSKSSVLFLIKNINILQNYLIPYFDKLVFLSKKGLDYSDFKIICRAIYYGAHRDDNIKSLIIKLSYTMNNYRLSSSKEEAEILTSEEMSLLKNSMGVLETLSHKT
ncbi:putative maturase [Tuber indicum]|nr:putative maturase [Tuber indicum]